MGDTPSFAPIRCAAEPASELVKNATPDRKEPGHRAVRIAMLWALWMAGGCDDTTQADRTSGHELPGTDDVVCRNEMNFALSPDRRWLIYESRRGTPFAPIFVLFDLSAEAPHATTLTPAASRLAMEGRGPALPACWNGASDTAYFSAHGTSFTVKVTDGAFEVTPVESAACRLPAADNAPPAPVTVDRMSPQRLRLRRPGGDVLAEHHTEHAFSDRLEAVHLRASPDGRLLAYVVSEYMGSIARPRRAYVLPLQDAALQPARLLAAPVYGPLQWASDRELYGCTRRLDESRSNPRIVRWRL